MCGRKGGNEKGVEVRGCVLLVKTSINDVYVCVGGGSNGAINMHKTTKCLAETGSCLV